MTADIIKQVPRDHVWDWWCLSRQLHCLLIRSPATDDYMTGRGTVYIAIKQLGDALLWPTAW